ncbi:divergent polysaccharide deacetylase family protein [Neorhizobium sp. CSC1952]|uniref:divergent polysaccharide deacetylase family protein n=1 Tax=Neorhizobium sp. CSC1952 TaxID=2978974 RepID=UPI0025A56861|nr:divergent polysaccharide deacetylase family protein [Rhizobium sp. CSC1952]WJR68945.1 divergent polysaccharide deacetylase family protein [Rhizobium sp. CSC1952]
MGTDLHAPLGQNRPAARRRTRKVSLAVVAVALAATVILGLSIYAMQGDDALKQAASDASATPKPEQVQSPAGNDPDAAAQQTAGMSRVNPTSGARIERTLTDDGSIVTKYTPGTRDGGGPVLIDAQRIGQDPRMAAQPNEALLEDSPYGRLPIVGPDGFRPMDQYARPWSGARGTRIAIVVGGLGLSQTGTQRAIQQLPPAVTLAFAASGNSLQRWMQEARRSGHEILIQVPFEPFDYPANDPGPGTLLTQTPPKENLGRLHEAMGRITNYTGIMNYLGGRYLSDAGALEPVLRDIAKRGLLFLDDGTSAQSKTEAIAKAIELPHAFGNLVLDGQLQKDAILKKLDELERIAGRKGTAVGIASAFDESVDAIRQWAEEASQRGIEIVGISALANESTRP